MAQGNQTIPLMNTTSTNDEDDDEYIESLDTQPDLSAIMGSINTYMALIKPYSGDTAKDQSTAIFFDTLEEMAKMASWPDSILHFVLLNKLSGKAAIYYETNLKSLRGKSLYEIRCRFSRRFDTQVLEDPWKAFQMCKQAIGEPVEDYAHRLIDLKDRCNNDGTDSYIGMDRALSLFMEGITPTLKEHMITIYPTTFGQAVSIASRIEKRLSSFNIKRGSAMMAAAVNISDDEDETITHSMSTLAICKEADANKGQKNRFMLSDPAENTTVIKRTNTQQEGNGARGKKYMKDKDKYREIRQQDANNTTKKSTFRDTSRNSIGSLNKQYGGTKHLVQIFVGKNMVKGLVDPASDYSIISEDTVRFLGLTSKIYKGEVSSIAGALGGLINSESCLDLIFRLNTGGDKYKHSFRLATGQQILNYSAILGMDFLQPNLALIDYHQNTLSLWGSLVARLIPVNKIQSSSNLLEFMVKENSQNNENAATEETQYILVHFLPDGSWVPIEEIPITPMVVATPEETIERDRYNILGDINDTLGTEPMAEDYLKPIIDRTHATGNGLKELLSLCKDFKAVMEPENSKLRILHNFTHSVELTDNTPIKKPQYQIPVALRGKLKDKLKEYMDSDIIEPSCSPWNLPLIVKQKKNGELRLILDATAVNKITKKIDYPIVRIEDTFHHLMNRKWFTSLDLKNGYHQIQLSTQSRQYYAFKTPYGKHHFKRMPMGASNSGLFFQRVMEKILAPLDTAKLVIYQDDILLATDTVDEHLELLKQIFEVFTKENVQINKDKSSFMRQEIEFLGHVLKRGSFTPSPENLAAINTLQPPKTKKQLRGILGKINFYARFVPSLSLIALPLTNLLANKKKEIAWGPTEDEAFNKLKILLCEAPILKYPDFSRKFIVTIRVSGSAMFSALEQDIPEGRWPVAYFSKKLTKPQQNYSVIERHALAVVTTLEHYHHIIHSYEVEVITDRKAVEYLRGLKDGSTRATNWINLAARYSPNYVFNQDNSAISHLLDTSDDTVATPQLELAELKDTRVDLLGQGERNTNRVIQEQLDTHEKTNTKQRDKDITDRESGTDNSTQSTHYTDKNTVEDSSGFPIAYTDGSCSRNGKPSATAGIGIYWENSHFPEYFGPCNEANSNNKAELQAIIRAISTAIDAQAPGVVICSDSSYAIVNITQNLEKWKGNNWLSIRGKNIENIEYFKIIDNLSGKIPIIWKHVRGHTGLAGNERAHTLALKGCVKAENHTSLENDIQKSASAETHSLAIRATAIPVALPISDSYIIDQQPGDSECKIICNQTSSAVLPKTWENGIRCYKDSAGVLHAKGIIEISPRIFKKIDSIYVPESCRKKILDFIHLNKWTCHNNYKTLCGAILDKYFWSSFRSDVQKYINECPDCQRMNASTKRPVIGDFPKPRQPGEKLAIDIIGPIITATGGEKYILTMVDMCSRYLTMGALKEISTVEVVKAIERYYIATFGTPTVILTDRGSNFRSNIFEEACNLMRVKHISTAPYRPSTNGMIERANKEVKRKLTLLCNHAGESWAEKLYLVGFAHNNAWHAGIGTSPNKLMFGHRMRFPGWEITSNLEIQNDDTIAFIEELRNRLNFVRTLAYEHETKERHKRNDRINRKRYIPTFKIGDLVMLRTVKQGKSRKHGFYFQYSGPYRIVKLVSNVSYDIRSVDSSDMTADIRVHAERLKPFVLSSDTDSAPSERTDKSDSSTDKGTNSIQEVTEEREEFIEPLPETIIKEVVVSEKEHINHPSPIDVTKPIIGRYHTRSKGKVDEEALKRTEIIRGKVVMTSNQKNKQT